MSLDALTGSLGITTAWNAHKNVSGFSNPNSNLNSDSKTITWKSLGAGAGQVNIVAVGLLSIAAAGSAALDLTNIADVLGGAANALATLKGYKFQLLSTADDPVNGSGCTSITIGNSGANEHPLNLGAGTMTIVLNNGEAAGWATAAAAGRPVDATHKVIKFTNNDAVNPAKVRYVIWG